PREMPMPACSQPQPEHVDHGYAFRRCPDCLLKCFFALLVKHAANRSSNDPGVVGSDRLIVREGGHRAIAVSQQAIRLGNPMFGRKPNSDVLTPLATKAISANVMIADSKFDIVYMNDAVVALLREAEADLKKELPQFNVATLIGTNIDVFHKDPRHQ